MTSPPAPEPRMRLCSAIRGRERWEVDALYDNPPLATALEAALQRHRGILRAKANPTSGRVLILYDPKSLGTRVEPLLRGTLEQLLGQAVVVPEAGEDSRPASRKLLSLLPGRGQLIRPVSLSVASHTLRIVQGLIVVATLNAALRKEPGRSLRRLLLARTGSRFWLMSLLLLLSTAADLYLQHQRKRAWRKLARDSEHALRTRVFAAIESQDMATLDKQGLGRLMNLVSRDTLQVGSFLERGVDGAIQNALTLLISGTLLLTTAPSLPLIACLPLPLVLLPLRSIRRRAVEARARAGERSDHFQQLLESSLSGMVDLKSFTAEQQELRRMSTAAREVAEGELESAEVSSFEAHALQGAFAGGFVVMTVYGGVKLKLGGLTQQSFTRAMYLFPQILGAVGGVGEVLGSYHTAASSAARLVELLESKPLIQGGSVRLPPEQGRGELLFEQVSFGYEPSKQVIEEVSFHLRPGETLAIVGPTGSGKSTLLRLLLRLYDVRGGRILLDGRDVRELDLKDLRSSISIVGQEPYLFDGTVRDNVLLGRPEASEEEVLGALERAGALEFVNALPGRLEAPVGRRGQRLSGGQRQRIAIARALLKRAPLLALDEATSHLDYETEAAIQKSVRDTSARTSMIVVAHRLATIRRANMILVLDAGRIREAGHHEELLAQGGLYAYLWKLQSGE